MPSLIVVDDEPQIRTMLQAYLGRLGHEVRLAASGGELRRLIDDALPDLVILDVGLPDEDGLSLARFLREHHDLAIIMLTGADTTVDVVVGLEVGADDYCVKPFAWAELSARIEAVLRRRAPVPHRLPDGMLPFGPYVFDLKAFRLLDDHGSEVELAPMELDLAAVFASRPGQALSRDDLLRLAPPRGDDALDRSIDNRITRLRRKLERDPEKPELIKTLRAVGYIHPGRSG